MGSSSFRTSEASKAPRMQNGRRHLLSAVDLALMTLPKCPQRFRLNTLPLAVHKHVPWSHRKPTSWTFPACRFNDLSIFSPANDNRQVAWISKGAFRVSVWLQKTPQAVGAGKPLPPVSRGDQTWLLNEEDKMIRVAWIPSSWVSATHPHPAYAGTAGGEKVEWRTDEQWARMSLDEKRVQIAKKEKELPLCSESSTKSN